MDVKIKTIIDGAGIVLLKQHHKTQQFNVICLINDDNTLDLPKGHIELRETPKKTALRECYEETGISNLKFQWGNSTRIIVGPLLMYIASTIEQPNIQQNPKTGIYEHTGIIALPFNDALSYVLPFLRPSIIWAREIVNGNIIN